MMYGRALGLHLGMTPEAIENAEAEYFERAYVSPNQINTFVRCPLQWYAKSVLRHRDEGGTMPLVLGSTVDKALHYMSLGHHEPDAIRFALIEHDMHRLYPSCLEEAYRQIAVGGEAMPFTNYVIGSQVELPEDSPSFNGLRLHGYADLVYHDNEGTMFIRDWKTSKRNPTMRPTSSGISVQLGIYALALDELRKAYECDRTVVEYFMTRSGKLLRIDDAEERLDQLKFFLDHTTDRMVRLQSVPTQNALCDWCHVKPNCPIWANQEVDMGILDTIRPASDHKQSFVSALIYGAPGAGKTHLAGSAATAGIKTLVLDTESGTMTIRDTPADVVSIRSSTDLRNAYTEIKQALAEGEFDYDLVVLDSLTEVQKLHIEELSGGGKKPLRIADWGTVIDATRRVVRAFRDLDIHVVVLALSKEVADDGGDGNTCVRVRPSVHGSTLPHELAGFFDVVGYAGIYQGEHKIIFRGTDRIIAKDRSRKLEPMEPNDWGVIASKILA